MKPHPSAKICCIWALRATCDWPQVLRVVKLAALARRDGGPGARPGNCPGAQVVR
jgi:hypothetical protein